jgi:hypothetical protein
MRPKDFIGWVITVAVEGGTASVIAAVIIRSSRSRWSRIKTTNDSTIIVTLSKQTIINRTTNVYFFAC